MLLKQRPTNHFNRWTGHCRIFWRIYRKIKRFVGLWFDENKAKIWEELIENNCFPNYDDYHFQNHNHYDYEDDSLSDIWEKQFLPKMDTNGFYKLNGNHKYNNLSSINLSVEKSTSKGCYKIGDFIKIIVTPLNFQKSQNWQYNFRNALEGKQGLTNQNGKIFEQKEDNKKPRVPRFMTKNGQCNIKHDAKEKTKRFLQDFFTTIVDMEWHYRNNVEKVNCPHRICMPTPLPQWRLFSLYFTRNFGTGGAARAYLFYWDCFYLVEIFLMLTFIEKIKFWWQDGKICQHWFFILKKYGYSYQYIGRALDNFQSFILDRKSSNYSFRIIRWVQKSLNSRNEQ